MNAEGTDTRGPGERTDTRGPGGRTDARGPRRGRRIGYRMATACALAGAGLLGGCGGGGQSTLHPHSGPAHDIRTLWWWMLAVAGVVFLGAVGLLLLAWMRRRRPGLPLLGEDEGATVGLVVVFGFVIPALVLVALFVVSDLGIRTTEAPAAGSTPLTVEVTGHQWFWEIRYPGTQAVTANELHIPVRTRVNVITKTADVIHSFWVPELNRKQDMVPGLPNRLLLYADKPGVYGGQCAEFCGAQHTHMGLLVFADPPQRFRSWLANMGAARVAPGTPTERRGEAVFQASQCASCHTIRGTPARGVIGPDLTHLATRSTLAARTIPNRPGYLGGWVLDPQHIKPESKMPGFNLSGPDFQALLAYLRSLR
ncbi:MAG: cytochrome c oxidase subunit II [Actinobacteria bacterium]|nr:MAG: cytochrome c oxidase subunit II [Actinomycetota bacterium]